MKYLQINCEFSDFLMSLAKTFYCETPDSEICFQLAKNNIYTYRYIRKHRRHTDCSYEDDIEFMDEITEEELKLLYHENVEIKILKTGERFGQAYYDLGFTFPSQDNMQFAMRYWSGILRLNFYN